MSEEGDLSDKKLLRVVPPGDEIAKRGREGLLEKGAGTRTRGPPEGKKRANNIHSLGTRCRAEGEKPITQLQLSRYSEILLLCNYRMLQYSKPTFPFLKSPSKL